ncbi:formate dehydrogenase accessory sulfurtransferase FdhD [Govanella unica]|uniref:Sulfur carrier protein FdhD n=1 Tax=Govanella unica TaxID=2975056 RepID=A0A9X3Z6C4_9PROT|nr:formate dehydrogenase accessory sulfurtransferase FdhD [Govania unica]MDA5192858.1 formate dehydrogenase accessory sulfurtransferase FdhD [Govania unica]
MRRLQPEISQTADAPATSRRFRGERRDAAGQTTPLLAQAVAEERAVEIRLNGLSQAVMMASPTDFEDFATGFAFTEGLIEDPADILSLTLRHEALGSVIDILAPMIEAEASTRALSGRSGCGLCGVRSLEDAMRCTADVTPQPAIDAAAIQAAVQALADHQPLNRETRAVHAAAWVARDGRIQAVREDVGRHNALDKLIGHLLRTQLDRHDGFLLITSRCSYEMAQKAAKADVGTLVAVSAPTALALTLAREVGLTLVAVARADSHILFTSPEK